MRKALYNGKHSGDFFTNGVKYDVVLVSNYAYKVVDNLGIQRWISKVNKYFLLF